MQEKKAAVLTSTEFKRVLAVARSTKHNLRNVALLYLSFSLGLRARELASLRLSDVMHPSSELKIEVLLTKASTKGNKQRIVYLSNKQTRKALQEYINYRKTKTSWPRDFTRERAPLFLSAKGGFFTANTIQMLFKSLYKSAGLPNASSHSGRRTFATSLIENGVDIKSVSSLMGHNSISMTARYVEENPVKLNRICEFIHIGL